MTIPQAWELSRRWYGTRLNPDFRRPTVEEAARDLCERGIDRRFLGALANGGDGGHRGHIEKRSSGDEQSGANVARAAGRERASRVKMRRNT
jgi:hypothetical protein